MSEANPSTSARRVRVGDGAHAWIAASGGWGYANAGLVVGRGESLLVDTLFDLKLTLALAEGLTNLTRTAPVTTLANTHANGDHWFGNEVFTDAEVIASEAAAAEMHAVGPDDVAGLQERDDAVGSFTRSAFGAFTFDDITPRYPDRTFTGAQRLDVGGVQVDLIEVGPAHTEGDVIVHVPSARTAYTGDILFAGGTPIVWTSPITGFLQACDTLLALDVDTYVPGHGQPSGRAALRDTQTYLRDVHEQASARFTRGMDAEAAALDIARSQGAAFTARPEKERLVANVFAVYHELDPSIAVPSAPRLFGCMASLLAATGSL